MLCLILISLKLIENIESDNNTKKLKDSLFNLPVIIEKALCLRKEIKKLAKHLTKENVIVITADGISYSLAKEGALKIKETSYKNISAAILGEFMHGHVAVLNNKATLIFISVDKISERSINNLNKIKEDYNPNIIIIGNGNERIKPDFCIDVKCNNEIQQLFANVIILQQIALETAIKLKRNVDNPKGLHKVVVDKTL
jgi:glucosamine--fructose-6-phosphate aminotransferase (isomerizing)